MTVEAHARIVFVLAVACGLLAIVSLIGRLMGF
jgi:hypothetical protein